MNDKQKKAGLIVAGIAGVLLFLYLLGKKSQTATSTSTNGSTGTGTTASSGTTGTTTGSGSLSNLINGNGTSLPSSPTFNTPITKTTLPTTTPAGGGIKVTTPGPPNPSTIGGLIQYDPNITTPTQGAT